MSLTDGDTHGKLGVHILATIITWSSGGGKKTRRRWSFPAAM